MIMLIYSENITPRLKYVVRFIFDDFLGIGAEITSEKELFLRTVSPKLSYSAKKISDEFNILPSGLLSENQVREIRPEVSIWNDMKIIFPVSGQADLTFDLFAGVFFLLARYEEYLPFKGDKYGRFRAEDSTAFKNGFLERAIVDRWIMRFFGILKEKYPDLRSARKNFRFIPTVDVDMPYEYICKGTLRCLGGAAKSILKLDFLKLKERLDVVTGKRQDPFYTFDRIKEIHDNPGLVTFFLTAGYGKYDKGIDPSNAEFKKIVNQVSFFSFIGLHPSWESTRKSGLLEQELNTFSRIAGKSITRSRQHYLIIEFPRTYNKLSSLGITEDYSMGYASHTGFRAGTCTPFHFYDLMKEDETPLVIYPFQVMDRTLKDYMKMRPAEAIQKINEIIDEVRAVNGTFISIWHNDTFSDAGEWKGWLDVYEKMVGTVNGEL
jgi:hypothetical protein